MGTSSSLEAAAAKIGKVAKIVDGQAKENALHAVGKEGKRIITDEYERDMGGNLSLSHWKGSNVRVGYDFITGDAVAFQPRDSKGGTVLRVLEENAGPHRINRKKRGRKKGRRGSLKIGGAFVGRSVLWTPRSGGKRTWVTSSQSMHREPWGKYFDREYAKELARIF